jgi:hypothetical protein
MKRARRTTTSANSALAMAIRSNNWELASLLLLDALTATARALPPGDLDDLLALISIEEDVDDARR